MVMESFTNLVNKVFSSHSFLVVDARGLVECNAYVINELML